MKDVLESQSMPFSSGEPPRRVAGEAGWRRWFYGFINGIYFQRIRLIYPERLPKQRPVLYLGLHRNGAVDGFVYHQVLRNPVFMISTQLRKTWFARLFFHGIAVARTRDEGDRALNDVALRHCLEHLRGGGQLFVFPEGTSSLGPHHLPFKSGAVWLLLDYLESGGPPITVLPVGIHYECPCAFRARVEVVPGRPVCTELPADTSRLERLKLIKRRIQEALEEVGTNVSSEQYQETMQRLAYVATLGTSRSYFKSLKAFEQTIPEEIRQAWSGLEPELRETKLWFHQSVPLFPTGPTGLYALILLLMTPIVAAAVIINLPPFVAAWIAGRKFPDDRNVISLWKILVGVPLFALWMIAVAVILAVIGRFWWLAGYVAVTWLGLKSYYRFKKLAVAVHNASLYPALQPRMLALHQTVLGSLPGER